MISEAETVCQYCGGMLKHYDYVTRKLKSKNGRKQTIKMERRYCKSCGRVQRVQTDDIVPYKHYEASVIEGVIEGLITEQTLGFEDYPSEKQMSRWKSQKIQVL